MNVNFSKYEYDDEDAYHVGIQEYSQTVKKT